MKKIVKSSLIAIALLPSMITTGYAATYDALGSGNDKFPFSSRVQTKSQPVVELITRAEAAFKEGKFVESENLLLEALASAKGNLNAESTLVSILGVVYAKQQQAEKLLPIAQDILERFPNETIALSTLAGAQIVNKQYSQAEKTLKQVISKESKDINHRLLLVNVLLKSSNREKDVESLLNEILQIQENNPKALLIKAKLQISQKKFLDALKTIEAIERFYPKKAIATHLKGDLNLAEKKYEKALKFYQQSYQIERNNRVLFLMVDLMKVLKKESAAFELLNNELKKDNKNLAIHFKLATIYQQQKNYLQAEKHFKVILAEQPENIIVLNNLAWNYFQQGKAEALGLAKKAYEKSPKSAEIVDTYGSILLEQGDKKQGLLLIKSAAEMAPKALDIQYHLALAYSKNGDNKQAISVLQQLEKQDAYFSEKKAASKLLETLAQ